jgi:mevalonate kinase
VIADLSFEVEKIHHGTPSGIDNNVVTYGKPVFFQRDLPIEFLEINQPTYWIIADTGEKTPTFETVSEVRKRQEADPQKYHKIFSKIGDTTRQAREALINGDLPILGQLIDKNQELLKQLNVSSPGIEHLVQAARDAGAYGAKLSGGGRGGNVIALASPSQIDSITTALIDAGAVNVISTKLSKES